MVVVEVNGYTIEPGANLEGAVLPRVTLFKANLSGACLKGAHLEGATFTDAENLEVRLVKGAVWDETTQWPPGFEKKLGAAGLSREKPSP